MITALRSAQMLLKGFLRKISVSVSQRKKKWLLRQIFPIQTQSMLTKRPDRPPTPSPSPLSLLPQFKSSGYFPALQQDTRGSFLSNPHPWFLRISQASDLCILLPLASNNLLKSKEETKTKEQNTLLRKKKKTEICIYTYTHPKPRWLDARIRTKSMAIRAKCLYQSPAILPQHALNIAT